ncbi:hypothetical protein, partial [Desulfosarcina cetonica]
SPNIPVVRDQSVQAIMMAQAGIDILRCPSCKQGTMRKIYEIPEGSGNSSFHILKPVLVSDKDP